MERPPGAERLKKQRGEEEGIKQLVRQLVDDQMEIEDAEEED